MTSIGPQHDVLQQRLDSLAQQTGTLSARQVIDTAKALGLSLSEDDVQALLARAHQRLEDAGDRSKDLRAHNHGGLYAGEQTVALATTPALQGKNLKVPKEIAKEWQPVLEQLHAIIDRIERGELTSPAADQALQALAQQAPALDVAALWSPAGKNTRAALHAAQDKVGALLPNAAVAVADGVQRTAGESALANHITEAVVQKDPALVNALASEYLKRFPDAAMAGWAQNLLSGAA